MLYKVKVGVLHDRIPQNSHDGETLYKKVWTYIIIYIYIYMYVGSVLFLLPVTVSKQVLLVLNKAFTNHHHPLLQVIIRIDPIL